MIKSENNKRVSLCGCRLCVCRVCVPAVCVCDPTYMHVCMYLSIWLWLMVISSHLIYCKMLNFTKRKCLLERKLLFLVLAAFLFGSVLLLLVVCADTAPVAGLSLSCHPTRFHSLSLTLSLSLCLFHPALLLSRRQLFVLPTISLLILNSFCQPNSLANAVGFVGTVSVSIAGTPPSLSPPFVYPLLGTPLGPASVCQLRCQLISKCCCIVATVSN